MTFSSRIGFIYGYWYINQYSFISNTLELVSRALDLTCLKVKLTLLLLSIWIIEVPLLEEVQSLILIVSIENLDISCLNCTLGMSSCIINIDLLGRIIEKLSDWRPGELCMNFITQSDSSDNEVIVDPNINGESVCAIIP